MKKIPRSVLTVASAASLIALAYYGFFVAQPKEQELRNRCMKICYAQEFDLLEVRGEYCVCDMTKLVLKREADDETAGYSDY
jgi:hypothetical protein